VRGLSSMRGTFHTGCPLAPPGLKNRRPSQ
jgi:hypothetical protein